MLRIAYGRWSQFVRHLSRRQYHRLIAVRKNGVASQLVKLRVRVIDVAQSTIDTDGALPQVEAIFEFHILGCGYEISPIRTLGYLINITFIVDKY